MARTNDDVAALLAEYADLLKIEGGDQFRIRAYENAARSVRGQQSDVADLDVRALTTIPNVGKSTAEKIREFVDTGRIAKLDELRERVGGGGVRDLLDVPGLGPKRAALLRDELGITSVDGLRAAAAGGALRGIEGFGETLERKILDALGADRGEARVHLGKARATAATVLESLRELAGVQRIEAAGSLRRCRETVHDVDILVAATDPEPIMEAFTSMSGVRDVLAHGDTKSSVVAASGLQVDLRVVRPEAWGAALVYFTGSKAHNVKIRERAVKRGLKLSEYGLFRVDDDSLVAAETEEDVYAALDLAWIPPTLREDSGEIDAAEQGTLPDLVEVTDLKGDLHGHTDLTDGVATLREMAEGAAAKGYEYYAITDHAPLLSMQRMTRQKAVAQRRSLRALEQEVGIALLHGSELNIQADGSVDWDEDFLAEFDVLVASVHSDFGLSRADQTARLVRAIEHPCVNIIGHPIARRQGKRDPIDFDLETVCRAAAANHTALEMNAQPERLDLPGDLVRAARDFGAPLVISTDAHSVPELDNMPLGVGTAQRGWATPDDVVNCRPLPALRRFLAKER